MWGRKTALACCVVLLGCERSVSLGIHIAPDDVAALAIVEENGAIRAVTFRADEASELELAEGDRAYVFVVPREAFVALDGAALSGETTRAAAVRLDDQAREPGKGACGYCVFPAEAPPQRIAPGDSCPFPPFSRALDLIADGRETEIEPLATVRARLLIDWPGTCP